MYIFKDINKAIKSFFNKVKRIVRDTEKVIREFEEEIKYSIINLKRIKIEKVYPIFIYKYFKSRSILRNEMII